MDDKGIREHSQWLLAQAASQWQAVNGKSSRQGKLSKVRQVVQGKAT
jgi:hypothetical protein